ncbi:hypothetical protein ACFOEK_00395 [Litoribrevibacter euphylliae]|uniref:Uncharacterized protein n=1 Tax=Litoribrevibacter euphylliae TaxID=1834034 RepID=A0ABV7H716_9GAMM
MGKQAILDINQGIYLVKLDAASRKQLVNNSLDNYQIRTLLIDLSHRMGIGVIAYCITNQSLVILYQAPASPEPFIQNIIKQYSAYANRTNQKRGALIKADYQLVLIEPEQPLLDAFHLVHNFPVTEELISEAENYSDSSYQEYSKNLQNTWLSTKVICPLIGRHETMLSRRFRDLIKQPAVYKYPEVISGNQPDKLAYCSPNYLDQLYAQPVALPNGIGLEEVIQFVCNLYQFKPIQLQTMRRHRLMPELKGMIAFLCQEYEIADPAAVQSELFMDDFDYERGLRLITQLSDTEMYERKHGFEQLLFQMDQRLPYNNDSPLTDSEEQPDNVHVLMTSPHVAIDSPDEHRGFEHTDDHTNPELMDEQLPDSQSQNDSDNHVLDDNPDDTSTKAV